MRVVTSLVRLLVGLAFVGVVSAVIGLILVLLLPFRIARIKVANVYGHIVGRTVTAIAGVTPRIRNRERLDGSMPAIYVMNHTSTLDAFIGVWMCPIGACGVMKKQIVYFPFYGQIAWLSGHLLIDRSNHERAIKSMKDTGDLMKKHRLGVWIMPEGTRSRDGRLLPFKKGFVHLALATGFPVVPVIVHGAHRNWKTGSFLDYSPMDLDIDILPPISTESWSDERAAEHAQAIHDVFAAHLADDQQPVAAAPAVAA